MAIVKLGEVAHEYKRTIKNRSGYPIVGLEHLTPAEIELTCWDENADTTFSKGFKKGHVLFGRRRAYLKKAAVAPFDGICSGDIIVIEANEERIRADLLPFIIQNDLMFDFAMSKSAGGLSPRVKWIDLMEYEFNLPSLSEQELLVELLSAAYETKKSYMNLISQTDEVVKSQFIEMFGDPVKNEKGWPLVRLDELAEVKIGPFGSLLHRDDYIEGGHALINPSHIIDGKIAIDPKLTISDEKYQELASYNMSIGDVVLGRRGEMGRCAVVDQEGYLCGTGSMMIRAGDAMKPYFLQNILSSPAYRRIIEGKAVGITMKNLNVPIVSSLMIPKLPIDLQEQYLELVEQSDKSKLIAS